MSFSDNFQTYVCIGDTITCEMDGYTITARIAHYDCADSPEHAQDGFWPSLDPQKAGWIGADKTQDDLDREHAKAENILRAWENDEWFYCGIVLSVERAGILLDAHAASLWGIEANYPNADNSYLTTVAEDLLPDALKAGADALARLVATEPEKRDDIVFRRFHQNANGWIGAVKNARLVGEGQTRFAAILDAHGAPIIIERRAQEDENWHQILPHEPSFETIATRLTLLWDNVMLETSA